MYKDEGGNVFDDDIKEVDGKKIQEIEVEKEENNIKESDNIITVDNTNNIPPQAIPPE